jgi:hypothetical protein
MAGEERGTAVGSDDRTDADGCASGSASTVRTPGLAAPPISSSRCLRQARESQN